MAPSNGGPDAVHDTQEPRQTTWQRYNRQPSSASKSCCWCVSGVESSPVASSQSVVSRSRESALHSRQRHQARTTHTKSTNKEARRHSNTGKGVHTDFAFRLAHKRPDGGPAAAVRCVWRVTAVDVGMM
ncbi:hypothetical protein TcCL_NonESM05400, partial [Trypanosoma cruzi]